MANPQFKDDQIQAQPPLANNSSGNDSFDEAPRRKMPKFVKYLAGTAVGLAILAGAGGYIATQLIDQDKYKSLIVSKVEEASGYTIDWKGNISLGLMPLPHASVNELTVKSGDAQILSIAKADVQVALAPLLSQKIDVRSVTLTEPVVTLTTAKNGTALWMATPKAQKVENASSAEGNSDTSKSPMAVSVNRVDINNGKFIIDNQQSGSKQELDKVNLSLHAETLSGPFDVTGDTEWSGQTIKIKATTGEINVDEGRYPVQAEIALPNAGSTLTFSGVVDGQNKSAKGDLSVEADDIASAVTSITGSAPNLPKGLDGKGSLAGKLVYSANRVAMDDLAVNAGDIGFSGKLSADGLSEGATPQLSFDLKPTSQSKNSNDQLIRILSDLSITAKGSMENEKIQISSAHIKTLGNDISISGSSSMGAKPTVDLVINADKVNLDNLNGSPKANSDSGAPTSSTSKSTPKNIGFSVPFAGRVRADVNALTTGGQTYSGIKADVVSSGNALTISNASIDLPQSTSISVNGRIANTPDMSGLDLNVKARTADVEKLMESYKITPPNLPKKIGSANMDGHFTGDIEKLGFGANLSALQFNVTGQGSVVTPLETPQISSLKFTVRHPNFNDAMRVVQPGFAGASGFSGALDISGNVAWGNDTYDVTGLSGKLGGVSIAGNISAATKPKTNVTGNLELGAITLPSATTGGGSGATSTSASSAPKGDRWSRDTIDSAWMRSMDADLKIHAKSITQNMWRLTDANVAFKLNNGVLTLDDVSAGLFGGRASINGVIKSGAGAKDPLSISAKLNANNVDAAGLMSAATGKVSHTLTGTLSGVDVAVNATGASPYALIQTLGGNGTVSGKNIVVQGIDAAQLAATARGSYKPLERAGSLFQTFQSGQTEFSDFNSVFTIQNGIVNFSKINFDGAKATLNSTGTVNLPEWTVNLKNSMVVKNTDIPPFDFSIRGPLDNPINSGGDLINNYLQNKLEKKATKFIEDKLGDKLGKILGGGNNETSPDGGEPNPQPNIKEEAAKEAVKALQGLFGR